MELRHIRYFVAVAEHLHFGRAASALATAQPSLSRQIVQLEDELGVKLFDRTNRSVSLTDAGRRFLADAYLTLQAADASVRHARENAEGTRGELRLAFIGGAMLTALPEILREYRLRYPNVGVVPHAMPYPKHFAALRSGSIDIAWTIAMPGPDIESMVATSHALMAVVPTNHRLANRREIDVKEFAGETLIMLARETAPVLAREAMRICMESGFEPTHVHEVFEEPTVLGMVAAGFGVAIVPSPWALISIEGTQFRRLASKSSLATTLSWHRERYTPIVKSFVELARDRLSVMSYVEVDTARGVTTVRRG